MSFIVPSHLTTKRRSVLYFPYSTLFSRVNRKGSTVLLQLIASIVGGSLLRRTHFESLRAAEAKNAATINHLMSKRQSVLYFTLSSRVKGHKGSPVLPRLLPSIVLGSLLRRAHFESLRGAEAKNSATINGCASCFIASRPHPRAIFAVMHSHDTLTCIKQCSSAYLMGNNNEFEKALKCKPCPQFRNPVSTTAWHLLQITDNTQGQQHTAYQYS